MKLILIAKVFKAKTHEHELMEKLIKYLRTEKIKFRVHEAGTKSIYITFTIDGKEGKVRIAHHKVPISSHPSTQKLQQERKVDFDIYPGSHVTVETVIEYLQTLT